METSTEINSLGKIVSFEKAVELIAKAGFDAWDFSMCFQYDWSQKSIINDYPLNDNYLKTARKLKQIGLDNGIVCNQSHAPFPTSDSKIESYLKKSIEATAEAGGSICVIHPNNDFSPQENAEIYNKLLPFAKQHSVKIATENMWNWDSIKNQPSFAACATPESFCAHLAEINDDDFIACLDIGHAEMRTLGTNAVDMIKALGPKLQALHIHDNDLFNDNHQLPFSMNIDFEKVVRALKEINYSGYFTLEANAYLESFNEEDAFRGIRDMAECAKKLALMFENQ